MLIRESADMTKAWAVKREIDADNPGQGVVVYYEMQIHVTHVEPYYFGNDEAGQMLYENFDTKTFYAKKAYDEKHPVKSRLDKLA